MVNGSVAELSIGEQSGKLTKTENPKRKEQIILDVEKIKNKLEERTSLSKLPAIKILEYQLDKNYQNILKKAPKARDLDIAYSLAVRFTKGISLYQRISEQGIAGPKDFERFDDPEALVSKMPQVCAKLLQAEKDIGRMRPAVKFHEDNGWLYLDQGRRGKTAYRIYLSPEPTAIGKVFSDLATEIPSGVNYQMKTFDQPNKAQEVTRIDKIIVYCSKDNFGTILEAVGRVYEQNQGVFQSRLGPGGGTIMPLKGISVAKEPIQKINQRKITATEEVANRIQARMDEKLSITTRNSIQQYNNIEEAYKSDEGRFFWAALSDSKEHIARDLYFPNNKISKDQKDIIAKAYLRAVYHAALKHYVEGKQITVSNIKDTFLQVIEAKKIALTDAQSSYLQNQMPYIYESRNIYGRIVNAARTTGLAIVLNKKLKTKQPLNEVFQEILAD
jgi:hypothetical protein